MTRRVTLVTALITIATAFSVAVATAAQQIVRVAWTIVTKGEKILKTTKINTIFLEKQRMRFFSSRMIFALPPNEVMIFFERNLLKCKKNP